MHRNYMRRGVSLEVIVEEDDNAEVSLDPVPFHDSTDTSSSPTLSGDSDVDNKSSSSTSSSTSSSSTMELENEEREPNHYRINSSATDRLRQEKEKRRKQKEEERWRFLERQRSLSCETLTILDVGEDEFSREQWEVETRDWDSENPNKVTEIEHCISRKKILASRFTEQELEYVEVEYESPPPKRKIEGDEEDAAGSERETHVDDDDDADGDDENETDNDEVGVENDRYWWNPEKVCQTDKCNPNAKASEYKETNENTITHKPAILNEDQEQDSLEDEPIAIETFSSSGSGEDEKEIRHEEINCDIEINQNYRKFDEVNNNSTHNFISSQNDNIQSSPFSCGEDSWITVGELIDGTEEKDQNTEEEEEEKNQPDELKSESPQNVRKEVRFSDKLEFLNDKQIKASKTAETNKLISDIHREVKEIKIIEKSREIAIEESTNYDSEVPINTNKDFEVLNNKTKESEVLMDNLVSVKAGKHLFERPQTNRCVPPLVERLTAVLETPDIMIIEKNDNSQGLENENTAEVLNEEESTLEKNKTRRNAKISPEELPPPRTVASVRKLFEQLPTLTVCNINQYKQLSARFDHVRSNPTSKILRFDRHDANHSMKSLERMKPLSSITSKNSNPKPSSSASTIIPQIPKEIHNSFPSCEEIREETRRRSQNWLPPKPPSDDFSATGVPLRKPQVANGFNVQKALRENPRYFHIRVDEKGKLIKDEEIKKGTRSIINQAKQKSNNEKGKRITKTYSYLEAKHQRHTGNTTSLRWIKEMVDRSDSESMSSESSEDSGVSRDFTSTIISSFTTSAKKKTSKRKDPIIQQEFLSDPSYKWIDPTVLAKIRARGTTVIYFGPRHRPQSQANRNRPIRKNPDYKLPAFEEEDLQSTEATSTEISKDVTFVDKRMKGKSDTKNDQENGAASGNIFPLNDPYTQTIISTNTNVNYNSNVKLEEETSRPKIIGVKHKRAPPQGTNETISSDSTNNNKDDNGQQQQFQPKPFLHTDSRIIHMRELKKKSTAANSVIYDFTEKET